MGEGVWVHFSPREGWKNQWNDPTNTPLHSAVESCRVHSHTGEAGERKNNRPIRNREEGAQRKEWVRGLYADLQRSPSIYATIQLEGAEEREGGGYAYATCPFLFESKKERKEKHISFCVFNCTYLHTHKTTWGGGGSQHGERAGWLLSRVCDRECRRLF